MASYLLSLLFLGVAFLLGMAGLQTRHRTSRLGLLPIILVFSIAAFQGINSLPFPPEVALAQGLVVGHFIVVWYAHTACLLAHDFEPPLNLPYSMPAWIEAYRTIFSSRNAPTGVEPSQKIGQRHIGTKVSPASKTPPKPAVLVGEKTSFAIWQASRILLCLGIYYFCNTLLPLFMPNLIDLLGPPTASLADQAVFLRRLSQVSAFEVALRVLCVIEFVATSWALANFTHCILSLIAVCILGVDSPREWAPLFGDIRDTYTIRSFWGRFWHRLVSATWVSVARPIVRRVFRVTSRGPSSRLLYTLLVFLFSSATHGVVAWQQGFVCGWWQEVIFFALNAVAIVAEDVVRILKLTAVPQWVRIFAGYCWTWGFMFWIVPKTQYLKLQCISYR